MYDVGTRVRFTEGSPAYGCGVRIGTVEGEAPLLDAVKRVAAANGTPYPLVIEEAGAVLVQVPDLPVLVVRADPSEEIPAAFLTFALPEHVEPI